VSGDDVTADGPVTPAPARLRDSGREDDRALLRAADPPLPAGVQPAVQAAVEARIAHLARRRRPAPRRRGWFWGGLGLLAAGSALAVTGAVQHLSRRPAVTTAAPAPAAPRHKAGPDWQPLAPRQPPAPVPGPGLQSPPARRAPAAAPPGPLALAPPEAPEAPEAPARPELPPSWRPALRAPGDWPLPEEPVEAAREARPPSAPGPAVRVSREGRPDFTMTVTSNRIEGWARGSSVALRLEGRQLLGKVGDQPVSLYTRRSFATGTISGQDTGFALATTTGGAVVRGAVPGHTLRIEVGRGFLSWYPGCQARIPERTPGVYEGACADGRRVRVSLARPFLELPEMPRLIVLGILLSERDPVFPATRRDLFPTPEP
jgi:hypothetical protein